MGKMLSNALSRVSHLRAAYYPPVIPLVCFISCLPCFYYIYENIGSTCAPRGSSLPPDIGGRLQNPRNVSFIIGRAVYALRGVS